MPLQARERNVEVITPALRRIRCRAIAFHPIAKRVFLAFELTALRLFFRKLYHAMKNGVAARVGFSDKAEECGEQFRGAEDRSSFCSFFSQFQRILTKEP